MRIYIFLVLYLLGASLFSQEADKIVFGTKNTLADTFSGKIGVTWASSAFLNQNFKMDQTLHSVVWHKLGKDSSMFVYKYDDEPDYTTIQMNEGYLDIFYTDSMAVIGVFDTLSSLISRLRRVDFFTEMAFERGMILCLDLKTLRIRVVMIDSCRRKKAFGKLISYYKKNRVFDKVIFTECYFKQFGGFGH